MSLLKKVFDDSVVSNFEIVTQDFCVKLSNIEVFAMFCGRQFVVDIKLFFKGPSQLVSSFFLVILKMHFAVLCFVSERHFSEKKEVHFTQLKMKTSLLHLPRQKFDQTRTKVDFTVQFHWMKVS